MEYSLRNSEEFGNLIYPLSLGNFMSLNNVINITLSKLAIESVN